MAPEVRKGSQYGFPADVYSLGVVAFELFEYTLPEFDQQMQTIYFLSLQFPSAPVVLPMIEDEPSIRPTMADSARFFTSLLYYLLTGQELTGNDSSDMNFRELNVAALMLDEVEVQQRFHSLMDSRRKRAGGTGGGGLGGGQTLSPVTSPRPSANPQAQGQKAAPVTRTVTGNANNNVPPPGTPPAPAMANTYAGPPNNNPNPGVYPARATATVIAPNNNNNNPSSANALPGRATATTQPRLSPHPKPNPNARGPQPSPVDFDEFTPKPNFNPLATSAAPQSQGATHVRSPTGGGQPTPKPGQGQGASPSVLLYQSGAQGERGQVTATAPNPRSVAQQFAQQNLAQGTTQRPTYQGQGQPQGQAQGQGQPRQGGQQGGGHGQGQPQGQGQGQGGQQGHQGQGHQGQGQPHAQLVRSLSQSEKSPRGVNPATLATSPRSRTMSPEVVSNMLSTKPTRPMKVLYDYNAQTASELTVQAGQRVEYLDQNASWALVMLPDGRQGWVPKGYLSPG